MQQIFRALVLASIALYVVWFFFPNIEPYIYDASRLEIWSGSGYDAKFEFPLWYHYLWFAFWIVASIGLYFFSSSARIAFIIGYILAIFLAPVHGSTIQSPWSGALATLNTLADGMIIALAYFSSVAHNFAKRAD